jgi:glucan phosphoethanolaminetransferase (alkaline phosphatase superfamily)
MLQSMQSSPTINWFKDLFSRQQRSLLWAWCTFFILFALLHAPNLLFASVDSPAGHLEYVEAIVHGLCFWLLWFALFPRIWMGLLLALIPALWLFPSLYLRWTYQTPITHYFYSMFAETDLQEMYSFVSVFGWAFLGGSILALVMIGLGVAITYKYRIGMRTGLRRWIVFVLAPLGLMLYIFFNKDEVQSLSTVHQHPFKGTAHKPWVDKWLAVYPTDLILAVWEYKMERQTIAKLRLQIDQFKFTEKLDSSAAPEVVVFVIGESALAKRWGLYGYERNTTPLLGARGDLIVLKDVVTRSTATRDAVPQMISRRPFIQGDRKPDPLAEPSLVKLFGDLGYNTYWISNQSVSGKHDSPVTFYATEARHQRFLNPVTHFVQGNYDEVILPVLEATLAKPGKKLIVLHTLGSHFNYDFRYPDGFRRFAATEHNPKNASAPSDKILAMSNSYDNTTVYTDYVLNQVLMQLSRIQVSAVMLYSSDHGEDVIKDGCKFTPPIRITHDSYWIPAFVWANQAAIDKNPQSYARLKSRANQPLTTSAYFDLITDLAAIRPDKHDSGHWLQSDWKVSTRWIYNGDGRAVDYDEIKRANTCSVWSNSDKVQQEIKK